MLRGVVESVRNRYGSASRARRVLYVMTLVMAMAICFVGLIYADVRITAGGAIRDPRRAPPKSVAIIFGAGYSRYGASAVLYDRVLTGVELYKAGKVRKLLMTGDNHVRSYNEPEVMRRTAVALGVPNEDIVLDYAGFRTYDSLYRARDIFQVKNALLVTQAYHLPRALYTARKLGMDVAGVAADRRLYRGQLKLSLRELLAVEMAWLETNILHPRPYFLGKPEPIVP
jgi:SanA protein